jgi:hypothetical protein
VAVLITRKVSLITYERHVRLVSHNAFGEFNHVSVSLTVANGEFNQVFGEEPQRW